MKKKNAIIVLLFTTVLLSCSDHNDWLKGTWETSNRTLGLMVNPQNGKGGVRTVLLEDKWILGSIEFQGNTLIFTYNNTDVQLTFRIDQNSRQIFTSEGSELKKVSSSFITSNHFN
jgi:hypothetical protein